MSRPRTSDQTPFGTRLTNKGISDADAAATLGKTPAYVGMLRRGAATPKLALALKIEDAFNVRVRTWQPYLSAE